MNVRIALLSGLVLALLVAAAPAEAAKRRVPQGFFGVMYDRDITRAPASQQDAHASLMARAGVESVRTVFSWAEAQPVPGPPDFSAIDAQVARFTRRGHSLLPVVLETPRWARRDPDRFASPPRNPADYAAFMRALVERYGPAGSFWRERPDLRRRPLREWQIWNEPHLPDYWFDPSDAWPRDYVALLREARAAVKGADPRAKIVLSGLANFIWRHLDRIYAAGGRGQFDVAGLNFYTSHVRNYEKMLKRVRKVTRKWRDRRRPVRLTEVAWPAARGRMAPAASWHRRWLQTDRGMARRLSQTYALLARKRRTYRLDRVYWYTWASGYTPGDLFDYGGLLSYSGGATRRRPALKAYVRSARRYEGCAKTSTGRCR